VHRARGDLARLARLRLDRGAEHDVHHAAAALRHEEQRERFLRRSRKAAS
jgi:hypothetical protein